MPCSRVWQYYTPHQTWWSSQTDTAARRICHSTRSSQSSASPEHPRAESSLMCAENSAISSQLLADHLWRCFICNNLPELQVCQKWHREAENLQPGMDVMIVDQKLPQALWPVGQVMRVFSREDGRFRTAELEVKNKIYLCPIARLIGLPALPD